MGHAKPLAAVFVVAVGSVLFLSACKEAEAPSHEATVTTTPRGDGDAGSDHDRRAALR